MNPPGMVVKGANYQGAVSVRGLGPSHLLQNCARGLIVCGVGAEEEKKSEVPSGGRAKKSWLFQRNTKHSDRKSKKKSVVRNTSKKLLLNIINSTFFALALGNKHS